MRWTNSWGRGLDRSAGRAPAHCVLSGDSTCRSFPTPFSTLQFSSSAALRTVSPLTKPNTSCKIEWRVSLSSEGVRVHPGMPFGFPSETAFGFTGILRRPLRGLQGQGSAFMGSNLGQPYRGAPLCSCWIVPRPARQNPSGLFTTEPCASGATIRADRPSYLSTTALLLTQRHGANTVVAATREKPHPARVRGCWVKIPQ
jgi:hypothetical protein